jgi:hypothetical protein
MLMKSQRPAAELQARKLTPVLFTMEGENAASFSGVASEMRACVGVPIFLLWSPKRLQNFATMHWTCSYENVNGANGARESIEHGEMLNMSPVA